MTDPNLFQASQIPLSIFIPCTWRRIRPTNFTAQVYTTREFSIYPILTMETFGIFTHHPGLILMSAEKGSFNFAKFKLFKLRKFPCLVWSMFLEEIGLLYILSLLPLLALFPQPKICVGLPFLEIKINTKHYTSRIKLYSQLFLKKRSQNTFPTDF